MANPFNSFDSRHILNRTYNPIVDKITKITFSENSCDLVYDNNSDVCEQALVGNALSNQTITTLPYYADEIDKKLANIYQIGRAHV